MTFNTERYNIYQDALHLYDESMITFVMVPLFDATNGLYMARTSIGMDDLTLNSQSYAEKIETNAKEIKTFDAAIANAQNVFLGRNRYAVADEMIEEIKTHMNSLIQRISRVTLRNREQKALISYEVTDISQGCYIRKQSRLLEGSTSRIAGDHLKLINMAMDELQLHVISSGLIFSSKIAAAYSSPLRYRILSD